MNKNLALVFLLAVSGSGCAAMRSSGAGPGFWYADVVTGVDATANQTGNRVGEACATSILGLIATGDASIEAGRRNGGITMISSVDEHFTNILGIYSKVCTVVRGR